MNPWLSPVFSILLLCFMIGNLVLPYSWGWIWRGYHPLHNDTILLSDPESPVQWIQRVWRLLLGACFIFGGIHLFAVTEDVLLMPLFLMLSLLVYGSMGCVIPAVLSLTDIKYVESGVARFHNFCYMVGCIALLCSNICVATLAFVSGHSLLGALCFILLFINVFVFVFYTMSDHQGVEGTILGYEGIWEFFFHLLAYLPLGVYCITTLS